jgi:biopolymer transport protein ExbB
MYHSKSPVARLIERGISRIGKPLNDQYSYGKCEGKLEIYRIKRKHVKRDLPGAKPQTGLFWDCKVET